MTRIAVFAFDIAEAAQIRRIQSLRALGHDVVSVSFRRANMNPNFRPQWRNLPLGITANHSYLRRMWQLARALVRTVRGRPFLKDTDIWIARNFDLLVLAALVRRITGRRDVRLVYECLDIHGLFMQAGLKGRLMRWAERRALAATDLLVLSSPGFLRHYFEPVQGYNGPTALIENKLWLGTEPYVRPKGRRTPDPARPLRLGWVGSLRCAASLDILEGVAKAVGGQVEIALYGNIHRHALLRIDYVLDAHPNIHYHGPYAYPDDLAAIYDACDLVWAQDLWQRGANSDWLLPNRIYEASFFGCPSIALSGTETGRRVRDLGLGYAVDAPTADAVVSLLGQLSPDEIAGAGNRLLEMPETAFRLMPDELTEALAPVLRATEKSCAKAA
ncbi:MAG: glycosyltransferase [Pseudomonadota bacterium]